MSVNAGVGYDVLNDQNTVTSSYIGGGAAFITNGVEPSPWVVNSGLGLTYTQGDGWDMSLNYDREDRGGSIDTQTAALKIKVSF